jgi:hypothetical protein
MKNICEHWKITAIKFTRNKMERENIIFVFFVVVGRGAYFSDQYLGS